MEKTKQTSMFSKVLFLTLLFSKVAFAATISDDSWLDQIVTFIKVNLEGNFAFIVIIVGITIGFISAIFGRWSVALTAVVGGILIGSIPFWAGIAQSMGQSFGN